MQTAGPLRPAVTRLRVAKRLASELPTPIVEPEPETNPSVTADGQWHKLIIAESRLSGKGVFACDEIPASSVVCEYKGYKMPACDAIRLEEELEQQMSDEMTPAECYTCFFKHKGQAMCVDASDPIFANTLGRNVNHQTHNANCELVLVNGVPVIRTKRTVQKGEELTYAYGDRRKDVVEANTWLQ